MKPPIISQPIFGNTRRIHMVGIGGIGMSGMAEILLRKGFEVSGSDGAAGEATERLEKMGATIHIGHASENIVGADVVVYTSAVKEDENVETKAALEKKIPVIKRAEMLAELMRMKYGIGIAGTHGKTTTTTMAGMVIREGAFDPTIIVGGRVHSFDKTNAVVGGGDIIIVEADEYDRTFLRLSPSMVVITNIDLEHLDIYTDLDDIKQSFLQFANKVPFYGSVILCLDDDNVRSIIPGIKRRTLTYGFTPQARLRPKNIENNAIFTEFDVELDRQILGRVKVMAPGDHNIRNALASIGLGLELSMPFESIRKGLEQFTGVFRRFQVKYNSDDIMVVDEYAQHPTEVQASISAARKGWPEKRIVAVFQPHLYSRTQQLFKEFGSSFFAADMIVVTDIYPSREKPIEGVTGKLISDTAHDFGHQSVHYVENKNNLPEELLSITKPGDLVITMGAGDIYKFGEAFVDLLKQKGKGA
jgi:UDP-N-acetylmuramate--alanine ligase